MVGGGQGAFIGAIHRMAANLDGNIELVCGAFSSHPDKSIVSGAELNIDENRCYRNYHDMFQSEATLPAHQRMQAVIIVTPNNLHFPVAKMAMEYGFHVISDKPATFNLAEAIELESIINKTNQLYALTHTYTGYPLIKQARELIKDGRLGKIKKVLVEYHQGWLVDKASEKSKQASWRLDPEQSGISCCMGDIGVHAANLAEYILSSEITDICAELNSTVSGRLLDDDGIVLLKFANQAKGHLSASQICAGEENNLRIRVYGETASLDWSQQEPNSLWLRSNTKPTQQIRTAVGNMMPFTLPAIRTPAGHPEGYIEAFANIYKNFVQQVIAYENGSISNSIESNLFYDVPGIKEAISGMAFIESVVSASKSELKWHNINTLSSRKLNDARK